MEIKREYDFPQVGKKDMYLLHHEEIESLAKNVPGVKRIRFFMTFGQSYLTHMKCLEDVGMLSTSPIQFEGREIVPIQFLKALLPDPASLGPRTEGPAARPRLSGPPHRRQDQHRLHLHRRQGRQGAHYLHLQRLRPSGVL